MNYMSDMHNKEKKSIYTDTSLNKHMLRWVATVK